MTANDRRVLGAGALCALAVAALAGCGSSGTIGSSDTSAAPPTVAPSTSAPPPSAPPPAPTTTRLSTATTSQATAPQASSTSTTEGVGHSPAEALAFVRGIYDPYTGPAASDPARLLGTCFGPSGSNCSLDPAAYVTPALSMELRRYARTYQSDPVVCAQNVPVRITYGPTSISGPSVTIVVHTFYLESSGATIVVTVDLSSLKLTHLTCQMPPG